MRIFFTSEDVSWLLLFLCLMIKCCFTVLFSVADYIVVFQYTHICVCVCVIKSFNCFRKNSSWNVFGDEALLSKTVLKDTLSLCWFYAGFSLTKNEFIKMLHLPDLGAS